MWDQWNNWKLEGYVFHNLMDCPLFVIANYGGDINHAIWPEGKCQGYLVQPGESIAIYERLRHVGLLEEADSAWYKEGEKDGQKGIWVFTNENGAFVLPGNDPNNVPTGPIQYLHSHDDVNYDEMTDEDEEENGTFLPQKEDGSLPKEGLDFMRMGHSNHVPEDSLPDWVDSGEEWMEEIEKRRKA